MRRISQRSGHVEFYVLIFVMMLVILIVRAVTIGVTGKDPLPWWGWLLLHPILDLMFGMAVIAVVACFIFAGEDAGKRVGLGYGQRGIWPRLLVLVLSLALTIGSVTLCCGWASWGTMGFWALLLVTGVWLFWAVIVTIGLSFVLPRYDPLMHMTAAEHDAAVADMYHRHQL